MKKIRIGSRESRLAVIQSQLIIDEIKKIEPEIEIELITMKTTGDIFLDKTLDKIGGKGLFLKELERALLDKKIDLAVHSLKDMPMEEHPELPILAYSRREDERDVLVLPKGVKEWDKSGLVGCSSKRRNIQLRKMYPGVQVEPIRGNVLTRLEKLDSGTYGALILAAAGLRRLGLAHRISRTFAPEEILPAAGQGIMAVQGRSEDCYPFLKELNDKQAEIAAKAERAFIGRLDGGCSSPTAAYGVVKDDKIALTGLYYDEEQDTYSIDEKTGSFAEAEAIGIFLADELQKRER